MTATLRRSGLLVLAAATAVTLAACGSDGTADPAPTTGAASSTTPASPTETATDTGEPAGDGSTQTEAGGAATGGGAGGAGAGAPAPNTDTEGGEAQPGQESGPDRSMHGPAEIAFLEQIDAVGVPYPNEVAAIDAGNVTCIFMERRQPYSETVDYIQRNLRTDAGQTGAVARAGIDHFCPEQFDYAAEAEERFRTNNE